MAAAIEARKSRTAKPSELRWQRAHTVQNRFETIAVFWPVRSILTGDTIAVRAV